MLKTKKSVIYLIMTLMVGMGALFLITTSASAAISPSNCNSNNFTINISKNTNIVVNGQTLIYTVSVTNNDVGGQLACDSNNTSITFFCPDATGAANGASTPLATNVDFLANGATATFTPLDCTLALNPGVTSITAAVKGSGNLQDAPVNDIFNIDKPLTTVLSTCEVKVDKQVSCDGGATFQDVGLEINNEDGTNGCSAVDGATVEAQYVVNNTGNIDVTNCTLNDSNIAFATGQTITGILAGGSVSINAISAECSDTLNASEPDTATLTCDCAVVNPAPITVTAKDTADINCVPCAVQLDKQMNCNIVNGVPDPTKWVDSCSTIDGSPIAVRYGITNTGQTDLVSCSLTDSNPLFDPNGTPIAAGDILNGAAEKFLDPTAGICNATLTASEPDTATVTCECSVNGVTDGNVSATDTANVTCPPQGKCLTRTPGFWGTHPRITEQVIADNGGSVPSCGLDVNKDRPKTPVSAVEDLCESNLDARANNTSPQQLQLIRQCLAAELNIVATAQAPISGDCESVLDSTGETISALMDRCCNGEGNLCDSGASGSVISGSDCIGLLDTFNNSGETVSGGLFDKPGPANSTYCKQSNGNGFVNPGRDLGPK